MRMRMFIRSVLIQFWPPFVSYPSFSYCCLYRFRVCSQLCLSSLLWQKVIRKVKSWNAYSVLKGKREGTADSPCISRPNPGRIPGGPGWRSGKWFWSRPVGRPTAVRARNGPTENRLGLPVFQCSHSLFTCLFALLQNDGRLRVRWGCWWEGGGFQIVQCSV